MLKLGTKGMLMDLPLTNRATGTAPKNNPMD
jgi:hypothetical protein